MRNSCSTSGWCFARVLPYLVFSIGGSNADHLERSRRFCPFPGRRSARRAAQHDANKLEPESTRLRQGIIIIGGAPAQGTDANPQPPATTSSSMASFVPTGGLHPIAGGQATATAMDLGSATGAVLHALGQELNSLVNPGSDEEVKSGAKGASHGLAVGQHGLGAEVAPQLLRASSSWVFARLLPYGIFNRRQQCRSPRTQSAIPLIS